MKRGPVVKATVDAMVEDSDLLEAVAKALYTWTDFGISKPWDDQKDTVKLHYQKLAQIALRAIQKELG